MLESIESRGLVLYNRDFREDDKLVKIFTERAGKLMFFVKHANNSRLNPMIQPLTLADMYLKINDDGLSYIEDIHEVHSFQGIHQDLFRLSYATYILALADASMQDRQPDSALFTFLEQTLRLMDRGLDYEILTNIFEMQILSRFGVSLNVHECCICHRVGLPFDFSFRFGGVLCPDHYDRDERRAHWDPNALYLLDQFQGVEFSELETISIHEEMNQKLRQCLDQLYDEYVGIHLKAKKFIDSLGSWGEILKDQSGGKI